MTLALPPQRIAGRIIIVIVTWAGIDDDRTRCVIVITVVAVIRRARSSGRGAQRETGDTGSNRSAWTPAAMPAMPMRRGRTCCYACNRKCRSKAGNRGAVPQSLKFMFASSAFKVPVRARMFRKTKRAPTCSARIYRNLNFSALANKQNVLLNKLVFYGVGPVLASGSARCSSNSIVESPRALVAVNRTVPIGEPRL